MTTYAVSAAGVVKQYAGERCVRALDGVSIGMQAGRFVSILGPSGCGKSTFLRCVAGLETISAGDLRVEGRPVKGPPDGIGMVFQRDALLDWRTVRRNVLLPIEFARKRVDDYAAKARDLLALTGLSEFADSYPHQLSGGMRQRAAICRALIDSPRLLLMDEPFGALDALTRDQMNVELQRIWLETRNTVLFVTHGISEAVFLADTVVVFSPRPGRIVETLHIDLPRPRPLSVRESPAFGAYVRRIRRLFQDMGLIDEGGADGGPANARRDGMRAEVSDAHE
ncbi:ABC transporter ATP-binding protein [Bordetella genomosp. 9]|uniref:ABC transporter ATP-binding protein n=1 Tax=Bordetella genomosp. 9 TaxID=1416803 RepID=A0A1W6Z0Y3_9BORD|nr:ABC transporter ATP-binding protein [Bordetella genomosp. 9]ARP86769.1 ABC transporter ATP-binding protein [Bordetella genomosp. 9]ARP90760.1 ABC transporter ATP-binding protein [Bordetella genomosp. 9]